MYIHMCVFYKYIYILYIQSYVVWLYPIESLKKRSSHWFAMSPEVGVCCFGGPRMAEDPTYEAKIAEVTSELRLVP